MVSEIKFDCLYGGESEQFSFYRIPRRLIIDDCFKRVSTDAKRLYGLMLDRMSLSAKTAGLMSRGECLSMVQFLIILLSRKIKSCELLCGHRKKELYLQNVLIVKLIMKEQYCIMQL